MIIVLARLVGRNDLPADYETREKRMRQIVEAMPGYLGLKHYTAADRRRGDPPTTSRQARRSACTRATWACSKTPSISTSPCCAASKNVLFGADDLFLAALTGPGKVWLQSLPLSNLAHALAPYLPRESSGSRAEGATAAGLAGAVIGGLLGGGRKD